MGVTGARCRVLIAACPPGITRECGEPAVESGPYGAWCTKHVGSYGMAPATYRPPPPPPPTTLPPLPDSPVEATPASSSTAGRAPAIATLYDRLRADHDAALLRIVALERRLTLLEKSRAIGA